MQKPKCFGINWETVAPGEIADVDVAKKDKNGHTPLHVAVYWNKNIDVADVLIRNGANVNEKNEDGDSPLHVLVSDIYVKPDFADLLIRNGANVNEKNKNGETPLHIAVRWSSAKDFTDLLIRNGANVNEKNKNGETPLHRAAYGENLDAVKLLINKGANINERNKRGEVPLHRAAHGQNTNVVKFLIDKGTNVNNRDKDGWTPLHMAAYNINPYVVELLVRNNANVSAKDINGWTPLHMAIANSKTDNTVWIERKEINTLRIITELTDRDERQKPDVFTLLADGSSNINAQADSGQTPLHLAAMFNNQAIVSILLKLGASASIKDAEGKTALDLGRNNPDFYESKAYWLLNNAFYSQKN